MRLIACAGLLASGLLLGAGGGIAVAEPDGSESQGAESQAGSESQSVGPEDGHDLGGSEATSNDDRPSSTFGSGREDNVGTPTGAEVIESDRGGSPKPKFKQTLSINVLRLPTPEEVTANGPSAYFTTVEVPVPTIGEFLAALSQPEPSPTPGPAFRGQEEAPVADSTGGGVDPVAAGGSEPPVFEAPLVVVPPPIPIPAVAASALRMPITAQGAPPQVASGQAATAGARAPVIRGTLAPAAEPAPAPSMTPMSGQATRLGYSRYVRNPTVSELAAVALPGLGGLLFLTFSGGVIGYRQANSVRFIRTEGAARFLR